MNKLNKSICKKCIHSDGVGNCISKSNRIESYMNIFYCDHGEQFELYEESDFDIYTDHDIIGYFDN